MNYSHNRIVNFLKAKNEALYVYALLIVSGLAGGWNMFGYPSYSNDEGTYMVRAVSVAYYHSLSPYTYWYDHAPGGSIIIGMWLRLTGGLHTFGQVINSGRVFMLIVHLVSTYFLYLIAKQYKVNKFFTLFTVLFFSLSPLAITLQRMVLLDNLMICAALIAFYLLVKAKNIYVGLISGFLLGISILMKETALFLIPAFLGLLYQKKPMSHRKFMSLTWMSAFLLTAAIYPIFALLRDELFPMSKALGAKQHVSLISSLQWQNSRKGGTFFHKSSQFYFSLVHSWIHTDPILIIIGFASTIGLLGIVYWRRQYLPLLLLTFGYIYYLIRGGIVNDPYVIPLIPLFALNSAVFLNEVYKKTQHNKFLNITAMAAISCIFIASLAWDVKNPDLYILNTTKPQIQAVNWVEKNVKQSSLTEIDSYAQPELLYYYGSNLYKNYGYEDYREVDQDPRLTDHILDNNWRNINYILASPSLLDDSPYNGLPLTQAAFTHSKIIKIFKAPAAPYKGINGMLYRESLHRHIALETKEYVNIYKVSSK